MNQQELEMCRFYAMDNSFLIYIAGIVVAYNLFTSLSNIF